MLQYDHPRNAEVAMQETESPGGEEKSSLGQPPTPATQLNRAVEAVDRTFGDEWDREFLESARELYAHLTATGPEGKLQVFKEHFRVWCDKLVSLQERLCGDLVRIAMANRGVIDGDPLAWVRANVERYWVWRREGFRGWVPLGCDWADLGGWSAPGWLLPLVPKEQLTSTITAHPMPQPNTEVIFLLVVGLIERYLLEAQYRVLDKAEIALAAEPRLSRSDQLQVLPVSPCAFDREAASAAHSSTKPVRAAIRPLDIASDANWDQVRITMAEHALHVEVKGKVVDVSFQDAGFEERRAGKLPDRLWHLLHVLAMRGGVLSFDEPQLNPKARVNLKQDISKLRKRLQALFLIEGDPFKDARKSREYQTRFPISAKEGITFPTPHGTTWDEVSISEVQPEVVRFSVQVQERFAAYTPDLEGKSRPELAVRQGYHVRQYNFRTLGLITKDGSADIRGSALLAVLRAGGKVKRNSQDKAMLLLAEFLCNFMQIEEPPFQYSSPSANPTEQAGHWYAVFEASSAFGRDLR
jgi:hypothetical protein